MQSKFERMRGAQAPDYKERLARLGALGRLLRENRAALIAAVDADFGGRARAETALLEITPLLSALRHTQRHLKRWMRDERRSVALEFQPARAFIRYEPLGVIGIISPWNYPYFLSFGPLIDALAAGNTALIKPSELTPKTADLIADLVARYFAPEVVSVVLGGAEVAQGFAGLPFDHLIFTGSTAVGRKVAQAAAENLTPLTLELGGKSPAIVADYPLEKAARAIAQGKFLNAGQTCIAPDYVLVPQGSVEAFGQMVFAQVARAYPNIQENPQFSAVLRGGERLSAMVDEAEAQGAVLLRGPQGAKFAPVLVLDPAPDTRLMQEEIFGPVLPIIGYKSLPEALEFIRARPKPLALYAFTETQSEVILRGAQSGGVTLNATILHIAQHALPFGGVGPSGMGAYHGQDGFKRFSHARAVFAPQFNVLDLVGPPYGRLSSLIGRIVGR